MASQALEAYPYTRYETLSGTITRLSKDAVPIVASLIEVGMTENQAISFADSYRAIEQYSDPLSGFSGTVFQDSRTGEYAFALRGTEPDDFVNDIILADLIGIALNGQAREQINAMNTFFGRLITPVDQGGSGTLNQDVIVNVTGHSLGGHLATIFTLFWRDHVNHTYTYNGAGTGGDEQGALMVQLQELLGFSSSAPIPDDLITNIFAEPGLEVVAGLGLVFGDSLPLFIEDQGPFAGNVLVENHSIRHLTDALAVYNLLAGLDPDLKVQDATAILETVSDQPKVSLEAIVDRVGEILFPTQYQSIGSVDNRGVLSSRIASLTQLIEGGDLNITIKNLTNDTTQEIASNSFFSIAYRYALVNLNSFVLTGDPGLYTVHNANGELDFYDPATGDGDLSREYLEGRALYLHELLRRNSIGGANEIRVRVEPIFAAQTAMGGMLVRTIGLARARVKIGMMNIVYNIRRVAYLETQRALSNI